MPDSSTVRLRTRLLCIASIASGFTWQLDPENSGGDATRSSSPEERNDGASGSDDTGDSPPWRN